MMFCQYICTNFLCLCVALVTLAKDDMFCLERGSGISEPLGINLHSVFCIQLFTCFVGGNKRMASECH